MALTDKLTAIADAIRAKTGKTGSLTLDQMPTEIANITGGGGSSADVRYVTFTNPATGETFVKPVAVGDDCVDVVAKGLWAKPTQESTAQYDYAFANSWSATPNGEADPNILKNITEDKTVYAVFTATLRMYTITYYDSDGTSVLKTEQVAYDTVPSYVPTKAGDTFEKWNPTPAAVTGDASYVAKWAGEISGTISDGAITWRIADNTLTFTGTGVMQNYSRVYDSSAGGTVAKTPWFAHKSKFSKVVIGEGITKLGTASFYAFENITELSFPSTFTGEWWAEYATERLTGVTSVNLAEGITAVGNLSAMSALKSIVLPQSLNRIKSYCFGNTGLTSATFLNTTGWWVSTDAAATSGTAVTVSNASTAADLLKNTHKDKYWNRT